MMKSDFVGMQGIECSLMCDVLRVLILRNCLGLCLVLMV